MTLRAIIFDMDGTLGDTLPFIIQALQETFRRYTGQEYTPDDIIGMFGPTEEGVILPRVPGPQGEEAVQYYLDRYAALHHVAPQPFPGVIDMLKALRARKVKIGIVTGKGPRTAFISMEAYGLEPYIDALVPGSFGGPEKPQAIQKILAAWCIPPKEAAYVGDMAYDMQAAREAGVLPLGAAWADSTTVDPDEPHRFRSVADLQSWLEKQI